MSIAIEELLDNREGFNRYTYVSVEEALSKVLERSNDAGLEEYRTHGLPKGLPEILHGRKCVVLFRHVATSNYEIQRFAMVADTYPELTPVVFEYQEDTFNDINDYKYHLGKLRLHKGFNRNGEPIVERRSIIDFTKSNGKPLSSLVTFSGERLVDVHHRLFSASFPHLKNSICDISFWLKDIAPTARDYYKTFLRLFVKDAVLFENFATDGRERAFTRDIILPAIEEIERECGCKPLIVALEPTDIEGDCFWLSHPHGISTML